MTVREIASLYRAWASDDEVARIIDAINKITRDGRMNKADMIVACAQILAQTITSADARFAGNIRGGVIALIDGFVMQIAAGGAP